MDPLSIASGAAGLFSTGVTICNGLITYCRNYRSREDDLSSLQGNAERLKGYLKVLEGQQNGAGVVTECTSLKASMDECMVACTNCLTELSQLSDKYSPKPSKGSNPSSPSSLIRRASYPFQKDKFEFFRRQIHELHFTLSCQIGLLNYASVKNLQQQTLSDSLSLSSIFTTESQEIKAQVAALVPDVSEALEAHVTKGQESLHARLDSLELMIKSSSQTIQMQTASKGPKSYAEITRTASEDLGNTPLVKETEHEQRPPPYIQESSCGRESSSNSNSLWTLKCYCAGSISPAYPVTHATSCYLSFRHRQRRALIGKVKLFNYFFQFQVAVEYSQYAFLRSLHIQNNFTIRATVPEGSPAFELLDDTTFNMARYKSAQALRNGLQSCLAGLQRLFMEGRAWPTDIETTTGNNLLHVACEAIWYLLADEMKEIYSQFLQTLVNFGVPLKDASRSDKTPVGIVMKTLVDIRRSSLTGITVATGLAKSLLDLGVDLLDIMPLQTLGPSVLAVLGNDIFEQQGTMDQDELPRALIERDEAKTLEILKSSDAQRHLSTRGKIGETPLHVATSWPRGMELLLELGGDTIPAMMNADDDNGSTALDYALKLNEPDCVKMLLEASAEMDLESMQNIAKWEQGREKWAIIPLLTHALTQRRRELLQFASETLSQKFEVKNLNIKSGALLQEDAFEVVQVLLDNGIDVPKRFRSVRPGSVYHSAHMNLELAQALFRSGFDHTNVDFLGFTPLMTVDLVALNRQHAAANLLGFDPGALDLVDWFISHGEDLETPIPTSGLSGIAGCEERHRGARLAHRVASELGRCLRWPLAFTGDRCTTILPRILTSPAEDTCSCLCTQDGCSPASVFARELWCSIRGGEASHGQPALGHSSLRVIMDLLTKQLSGHPGARKFASEFIRVSTFERLGMSHTCCRFIDHGGKYEGLGNEVNFAILKKEYKIINIMDAEDVAEIQEEERYLEGLLEKLVEEFEIRYEELGLPLGNFFLTYWWVRMDELDTGSKVSQEELESLRKTGVVIDA
ncbi:hypothetical protein DHEL01_v200083 [Diaporthe helianthi]|uniref:Azaphilone pigments biosynthesis cluster protein L N-terminal domain-containing protein n=1 Tax=Diaporthe helianthi TaxID=158607 RepID=A0A2P5IG78_DIAHE|nr:hypothetical protein DHEL01_v200083 [Diaporthe helianthi]